jgi:hypothetical protein
MNLVDVVALSYMECRKGDHAAQNINRKIEASALSTASLITDMP